MKFAKFLAVLAAFTLIASLFLPLTAVSAATNTLLPTAYVTTAGGSGGQPVANLHIQDQSGTQDDWNKYVEFTTPSANYAGYRQYTLPAGISPSSLTGIQVKVNYKGPLKSTQTWSWKIYNWSTSAWVSLGDNAAAQSWKWSLLTFNATGTFANYVKGDTREIRIRLQSNNAKDNALLDYESLTVTYGGSGATSTPTTIPSTATFTPTATLPGPTATFTPIPPTNTPVPPTNTPLPGGWWKPGVETTWHWELDSTPNIVNTYPVAMYDIDLFNTDTSVIDALHAKGIKVICYFSAGSYEDGRPDSSRFTAADKGKKMQGWPEYWIDTRSANIRSIMADRIQLCKDKGFDGVEPDNIDGYSNSTGFPLTYATQLDYNRFLATTAHNLGLAILLKNDGDQAVDLWQDFDGELNEQCFEYSECEVLNTYFVQNNKPVFHVEYGTALNTFCPTTAGLLNFNSIRKPGDTVDSTYQPCP